MSGLVFTKINQRTVQSSVADALRDAIISGAVQPGQRLIESEIAKQMAVSRAPLREALRQLEQEGLVTRHPNRGCFVTDFSEQDVIEVISLRCVLECMAIEWATPRITAEDIAVLRSLIEEARQATDAGDLNRLTRVDMQFHEYICAKAGHGRLLKAWLAQHAQSRMLLNLRFHVLSSFTPQTVVPDHTNIANALERRDTAEAIRLTKEISTRVQQECIDVVRHRSLRSLQPTR